MRRPRIKSLLRTGWILFAIAATQAPADTIYVDSDAPGKPDGTSWDTAYTTIQDGVDAATDGDTVIVRPRSGAYCSETVEVGGTDYRLCITNDITVCKEPGSATPFVVLTGTDKISGVYLTDGTLEDFVIAGCSGNNGGGAALIGGGTLSRCRLQGNAASGKGGGAYLQGNAKLQDCLVIENSSTSSGGGVYVIGVGDLINCTVADNTSDVATGTQLTCSGGGDVINCILYDHSPGSGETVFAPDSASVSYTCSPNGVSELVNGCLTAPPDFVDPSRTDNYRLASTSPCIDMGDTSKASSLDLDSDTRTEFGTVDMGAYESTSELTTVYVDDINSSDDYNGRSLASAKRTLQAAANAAPTNGTVLANSGTYRYGSGTNNGADGVEINRVALSKNLTLQSLYGPEQTVISGEATMRGAFIYSGCTLDGFTIENAAGSLGGGVVLVSGALMTNCVIQSCEADKGGGVYFNQGGTMNSCTVKNSSALDGGGVYIKDAGTLNDCRIESNVAELDVQSDGGGVYMSGGTLTRCRISKNTAKDGGGVYMNSGTLNVCTVQNNIAEYGGGVYAQNASRVINCLVSHNDASEDWGGVYLNNADAEITGCTLAENQDSSGEGSQLSVYTTNRIQNCIFSKENPAPGEIVVYLWTTRPLLDACCIYGETNNYTNCITANPLFLDPQNGNFALHSDSPCIDAGTNSAASDSTDLVDNPRIRNSVVDLGALEWVPPMYVDSLRPDDSGDGLSWATAKQTLQAAVDAADPYSAVYVTNGVYSAGFAVGDDASVSNRVVLSRGISLYSMNGAGHTVIDGADAMRCALLTPQTSLTGFTLRSGRTATAGSSSLDRAGGGAFLSGGGALYHCVVENCEADNVGGGVYLKNGGTVDTCLIHNNISGSSGGGAYLSAGGLLRGCTVADNDSLIDSGEGVRVYNGGTLQNCIVSCGDPEGSVLSESGVPAATFSCICAPDGVTDGANGCITNDPALNDPLSMDYTLASHSPCINAGSNALINTRTDLAGNRRILLDTVDIGAFEYIATYATVYVDASRPDDSGTGIDWATAKKTLQAAVDTCAESGTVWVASGTYDLGESAAMESFDSISNRLCIYKQVAVRSADGAQSTVIDGSDALRGVYLENGCTLDGFTIRNGWAEPDSWPGGNGGGVYLDGDALVANCSIEECEASAGGGVWLDRGGAVTNCEIFGCTSSSMGGAVYLNRDGSLVNCLIEQNTAGYYYGSAVDLIGGGLVDHCILRENSPGGAGLMGSAVMNHCLIVDNDGGGLCTDDECVILNSTIAENRALDSETQVWLDDESLMANCIVWNSLADESDNVFDVRSGAQLWNICAPDGITHGANDCITNDPQFVDMIDDDFRPAGGSPCIDAGNNTFTVSSQLDLAGTPRMLNGITDIGAYEYHPILGNDLDEDGMNDAWEIQYFGSTITCIPGDTHGDDDPFNNLEEFIAGTCPTNTASAFVITNSAQTAEGFLLEWAAVSGRVYAVEWTPDLMESFQPLENDITWPAHNCLTTNGSQGFYRLNVQLDP